MNKIKLAVLLIGTLILASIITYFSFGNVKEYNDEDQIVGIKRSVWGSGQLTYGDVAEMKLETSVHRNILPHNTDINNHAFELTVTNSEENYKDWLSKMEYYNKKTPSSPIGNEITGRDFFYRYWNPTHEWNETIIDYSFSKDKDDFGDRNATVTGSYNITRVGMWLPFNEKADLPKGEIKIRAYLDVNEGETIEWIGTFFGVRVVEWADFTGSDLFEYNADSDVHSTNVYDDEQRGQAYTVGVRGENIKFNITHIEVLTKKVGTPPTDLDITLMGLNDADGKPNGTTLSTGIVNITNVSTDILWSYAEMTAYQCEPDENYTIILSCATCNASNYYDFRQDDTGANYTGGHYMYSSNGGSSWDINTARDGLFKVYGVNTSDIPDNFLNVTVFSPTNTTYATKTITFNISTDTNFSSAVMSPDSFVTNYTMTLTNVTYATFTNNTMTEGNHTAHFWVNDTAGNDNNTVSVTFTVDTINPALSVDYPTASANYSTNISVFNYTVTDSGSGVSSCWYSIDAGATNSTPVNDASDFTDVTSVEGNNTWEVYCNDTADNLNESSVTFTKDTDPPYFTNLVDQSVISNQSLNYDIDASDDVSDVDTFTINWSGTFSITRAGVLTNTTNLTIGTHYKINVSVNDTAGSENSSILDIHFKTNQSIYDEIDDSSVDSALWENETSGDVVKVFENNLWLEVNTSGTTEAPSYATINSTNMVNLSVIDELELRVRLEAAHDSGDSGNHSWAGLTVFGNEIKSLVYSASGGEIVNDSIWILTRNKSAGTNKFDVTENGASIKQITATDNVIKVNVSREHEGSDTWLGSSARIYYVYYTLGTGAITTTLNAPPDNFESIERNVTFNISSVVAANQLQNASLFIDGVYNQTKEITGVSNSTTFDVGFTNASYVWGVSVCNNESDCDWSDNRTLTIFNSEVTGEHFSNITTEGSSEEFELNVSTSGGIVTLAYLVYNSTSYPGTITDLGGDAFTLTRTVTVGQVDTTFNASFNWIVSLDDGTSRNSTISNQTINNINIDDCSVYGILLLDFTLKDEDSQAVLNATLYDNLVGVDVDIYALGNSTPFIEYYGNYSQDNNPQVCMEKDLGNTSYTMDVQVFYKGDNYAYEYYHIQNYSLINSTLGYEIDLLDLNSSNSQEFKIIFKDENFLAVEDALIQIQRKYIDEGVFKTVEIPKTDSEGETIGNFRLSDTIYTIIVIKNGVTLGTFSNIRPYCQNPTLDNCEINLNSFSTSIQPKDYTVGDDFAFTLAFNTTSRVITSLFSIPSSVPSDVVLNATLFDNLGGNQVCSDTLSSAAGTLTCAVPVSFGNGTVIVKIFKDGVLEGKAFISLEQEPEDLYGASLVFLGLFLILTIVGMGISDNPMITGVFILIGAILLITLNLIDTGTSSFIGAGATFLWIVIAIAVVLVKGSRRM